MPLASRWVAAFVLAGSVSCTGESSRRTSPEALLRALAPGRDEATAVHEVSALGPSALPGLKQLVGAPHDHVVRERALLATTHLLLEARGSSAAWTVSSSGGRIALARAIQTRNVANRFGDLGQVGEGRCVGTFEFVPSFDLEAFRRRQDEAEGVRRQMADLRSSLARRCGRLKSELVDCPPGAREETRSKLKELSSRRPSLPAYQLADGSALSVTLTVLPWTLSGGDGQTDCEAAVVAVARGVGRPFDAAFLFEPVEVPAWRLGAGDDF